MSYINVRSFFENPEKAWQELIEEQKARKYGMTGQYSLFPEWEGGLDFRNSQKTGLKAPK